MLKRIRLKGFNYAASRWYFVTGVTAGRRCNLSRVEGCAVKLSKYGRLLSEAWHDTPEKRPYVVLGPFTVMPNHFHGLIGIAAVQDVQAEELVERVIPETPDSFGSRSSESLGVVVGAIKGSVTKRVNELRKTPGAEFWQRRFHEHVVRNEREWEEIASYILWNPINWHVDHENPEGVPTPAEVEFWKKINGL